jgi:hypothetical protein
MLGASDMAAAPPRDGRLALRLACLLLLSMGPGCRESEAARGAVDPAPDAVATSPAETGRAQASALLPERRLTCTVARATNVDLSRQQDRAELQFEGQHRLDLFLPAIAAPAPGKFDPAADAVAPDADPRTRITADPDGLARELKGSFERVADNWPVRVELSGEVGPRSFLLLILNPIDQAAGKADLFMTYTNDTLNYDVKRIYLGSCDVAERAVSVAAADR